MINRNMLIRNASIFIVIALIAVVIAVMFNTKDAAYTSNTNDLLPTLTSIESLILEKQTGCSYQKNANGLAFKYKDGRSSQLPKEIMDKIKVPESLNPYVSLNKTALTFIENGKLIVAYSNDEGKNWNYSNPIDKTPGLSPIGVPYPAADYNKFFFCFISKNNGYLLLWHGSVAAGQGSASVLAKTTDGGKNWTLSNAEGFYVSGMYFSDNNIGYIATLVAQPQADIYRTTNGGNNWETANLVYTDSFSKQDVNAFYTPYFVNKKGYMPVSYQNGSLKYFTSDDNGETWKYDPSLDCPYYFTN
jgi:hypothetical protein